MVSPSVRVHRLFWRRSGRRTFSVRAALLGAAAVLSEREREVADLVGHGLTNDEISRQMHVSVPTVKSFLARAFRKTGVASRAELAAWLLRREN